MNKKVLVITYYWPPLGGSGVQRWLKFVKYLAKEGWEPFVYTPENPSFTIRDTSLLKDIPNNVEVIKLPIWEPYQIFFRLSKFLGKSARQTDFITIGEKTFFQKVSSWIRGNLFIPDPKIFWVRPSVNFLQDFLKANEIQKIITTGPPHSIHLIGLKLKQKNPALKWVADFRDPWSQWGFLDSLMLMSITRNLHIRLERKILSTADIVITITPFYVRQLEKLSRRKVELITNGFDQDDFQNIKIIKAKKFTMRHIGLINEKCNPRPFMQALFQMIINDNDFASNVVLEFVGEVHPEFKEFVNGIPRLKAITNFIPSLPHKELIQIYGSSSLLLIILTGYKDAEGYMPGKLFEYLATGLPILGIGPINGDAANVLKKTKAGEFFDDEDINGIKSAILSIYSNWKLQIGYRVSDIRSFSRKELTEQLINILNRN